VSRTSKIESLLDRKPSQLSGASASASPWEGRWCAIPALFLFDEPPLISTLNCGSKCAPDQKSFISGSAKTIVYVTPLTPR